MNNLVVPLTLATLKMEFLELMTRYSICMGRQELIFVKDVDSLSYFLL